ncbi:MAG: methyltransferase domain-containing protein [Planctomycetota bacterium]|jgi:SAM-dependent methyltransferase
MRVDFCTVDGPQSRPKTSPEDTVAGFWNERHQDPDADAHDNFLAHPLVQTYISLRALGSNIGHLDAAIHAIRSRTRPGSKILSLGCGPATKEQAIATALPDRKLLAIDIAAEAVAQAREQAAAAGISNLELRIGDFNKLKELDLEPGCLDILLGLGAIHHVENLEGLWTAAQQLLSASGVVMAQEYIGPNRLQWTEMQMAAGSDALQQIVPDEHKIHHREVIRIEAADIAALDPSEAVRSAEILPTAEAAGFAREAYASAGGALLQPVLMHQVHTYDPQNWGHNLILSRLFAAEDQLMRAGTLSDDFAMFVLRRG